MTPKTPFSDEDLKKEKYPMTYESFGVTFQNDKKRKSFERKTYLFVFLSWLGCLVFINGLFYLIYEVFLK